MRRFVALAAAFTFAVLQFAVRPAGAAVFTESGDAGGLLPTAQSAIPVGPLTQITGTLDGGPDEDLYRICIAGGGTFSATTEGTGTRSDTQLFLFDESGFGVYANDDSVGGSPTQRSTLPAGHSLTPTAPGIYYLGISTWNRDPASAAGPIFPGFGVVGPTGSGGGSPLASWTGTANTAGTYTINLTGTCSQSSQSLPGVVTSSTQWALGDALADAGGITSTFSLGTRPLVPVVGDWDGDGTKTPGYYKDGQFTLSDSIPPTTTFTVSFTSDPRGFPVAGDFDGDGRDDLAVFRNGLWQLRLADGSTTSFTYGSGTWPNVIPVAGDWDGDGTDGIGTYTLATGTWALRQTASAGAPDIGPFVFWTGSGSYPVVGDWDADGDDTVGVKNGSTWSLNYQNDSSLPPDLAFTFGAASDLPVVWARAVTS